MSERPTAALVTTTRGAGEVVARRVGRRSRRGALGLMAAGLAGRVLASAGAVAGLVAPLGLAGCDRQGSGSGSAGSAAEPKRTARPSFKATDITGADYGKTLSLTDAQGKARTLDEFRGKVVLVFFGFTQCPDVCPTTLAKAADVKKRLGSEGDQLQVLFVTLDPDRDTAEVLGPYVSAFDPAFIALRGDAAQTQAAAREFRVFFQKVPNRDGSSYTIDHTAASYVIDPRGQLRLFVKHAQDADDIASDIRQLIG